MCKVSVLMPVYNVKEEYLRASIESILNQSFTNFEFIILDDNSTKSIENIINSYNDKRMKFYKNSSNLGIAESRNKLMDLARGEYAALMDNDDIADKNRLLKQVEFLDNHPSVSILGSAYETLTDKNIIRHPDSVNYFDLIKGCVIAHPSVMFRLNDLRKHNLRYNSKFICSQDYELWSRAIRFLKIANLPDVLLKYRIFEESITQKKAKLAFEEDQIIKQNMLDFLTNDKSIQNSIKLMFFDSTNIRENTLLENIFSIRNIKSQKVITILGIKIKIKRRKK